jgi:hypothetical protein
MDDIVTLSFTLVLLTVMCLYIVIVAKFKYAFKKRFELIYRGGIPILIFGVYQLVVALLGYNIYALLLSLGVLANAIMAWKLWNDDSFLIDVLNLKVLGRRSLFLYYYLETNDELDANVAQWTKHSASFQTVIKVIEDNKLTEMTREQFETDEKWAQHQKSIEAYEAHKAEADSYRVEVLGFTSILSGFKMLLFVHQGPLSEHILEGNCIKIKKPIDIEGRKFEKVICFEGPENTRTQQRLEASADYLDILSSLTALESIPNKDARITKLEELNAKQRETMDKMKDDIILSEESVKYGLPSRTTDQRLMKLILYAILTPAILVVLFVILSIVGVV